ncbi:DUF3618 domain-containing protein [Nocardioides halotolerans]|uniref:DUF3618 domain-containing protein n=1 Tax=Nocardioides halotolerans TaxID=433660 RepID=UPI00042399D7|nr:DUF3618 domain-containing protein [Nocardioides halotolerans]
MAKGKAEQGPSGLEREIEETRERLAGTIDELLYRSHPRTIVSREVSQVKAFFVDPVTGEPRTENVLKVAAGVVGTIVVFALIRRVTR